MLITIWGPVIPDAVIYDYSNRQWNGLLEGYYKVRWARFLEYLQHQPRDSTRFTQKGLKMSEDRPANIANDFYIKLSKWEQKWCNRHEKYPDQPRGEPMTIAENLYHKWYPVAMEMYDQSKK